MGQGGMHVAGQTAGRFGINISEIGEIDTMIGTSGAIRAGEVLNDQVFDYIIGIAILIYETNPGG